MHDGLLAQVNAAPIHWIMCWVDGGVFDANPSPRGVYWSVRIEDGPAKPVILRRSSDEYTTNNEAEWLALEEAVGYLVAHHPTMPAVVHSDSQLVVNQFNGKCATRDARMLALRDRCRALASPLHGRLIVRQVPREVSVEKLGH